MRKVLLSIVAASTALTAVPATAQGWRLQPTAQREIRGDIAQLQNQIQRAAQRRTISQREAAGLRREAQGIRQLLNRYSRNGLSRAEVTALEVRVNRLRQRLRLERRDWDGRRG